VILQTQLLYALISTTGSGSILLRFKGTSTIHVTHDCLLVDVPLMNGEAGNQSTVRRAPSSDNLGQFRVPVLYLSIARYDNLVAGIVMGVAERNHSIWERLGTYAAGTELLQMTQDKEVVFV
jgi:hypothetical protein